MLLLCAVLLLVSLLSLGSAYSNLSDDTLKHLPDAGEDFDIKRGSLLAPILRTRVSGTEGNVAVRQHFVDFFKSQLPEWRIELHNSTSTTPVSGGREVPFVNIIATRDPPDSREGDVSRLALVAHYDSKYTPKGFIGAIDSAAPCAMIMHVARSIDAALTKKWAAGGGDDLDVEYRGVQILLLDGEEAFKSWTDSDSLYGARYGMVASISLSMTDQRCIVLSPETGSPHSTRPRPHIVRLSTQLSFSFYSTCWALKDHAYHHILKLRTGHISTWLKQRTAFGSWAC